MRTCGQLNIISFYNQIPEWDVIRQNFRIILTLYSIMDVNSMGNNYVIVCEFRDNLVMLTSYENVVAIVT